MIRRSREPTILHYFFMPGCPACEETSPEVERFRALVPGITIEKVDITEVEWPQGIWAPEVTPTFVLTKHNMRARMKTGVQTAEELQEWILGTTHSA